MTRSGAAGAQIPCPAVRGTDDLSGGLDNDWLEGGPGLGTVRGDEGDDLMSHHYGQSDLAQSDYWGGAGTDDMSYYGMATGVRVSLNNIADDGPIVPVFSAHNVHDDVERVIGTFFDDSIEGHDGPNTLLGVGGSDELRGRGGDDRLDADTGSGQRIYGGTGRDTCIGDNLSVADQCEVVGA